MSSHNFLIQEYKPVKQVYISNNADQIVRNASNLLIDEIGHKSGILISTVESNILPAISLVISDEESFNDKLAADAVASAKIEHEEGFSICSANKMVIIAGKSGSGVLYAVDHILDSLEYSENSVLLPVLNISDQPDNELRGASFCTHSYGNYVEDSNQLDLMKQQIRFYARNRINAITIEATGKKWPGDLTPIVTWKYFPPLADKSRNDKVALRIRNINELIDYAHSWGIKVILYTSEFNHEPDIYQRCPELHGVLPETWKDGRHNYIRGCICLSKEIAWQYWHAKVKEAVEALPELDGLELWMAEVPSEFGICACLDCRKLARHEWLEKWFNATRETIDEVRPDLQLYIKTFQSSQGSLEVERFAPLRGKLPHNCTIVTKCQFGDMAYLNDPHPLLGWIQDGNEATEFDVGGEYRGCGVGAMICCIPEYIAERMRFYYGRGLRKFYARHAVPTWPNKEFLDINDTAFYKLAWNVEANVDDIWMNWAEGRFGKTAAPGMVELLKMTDEAVNKILYVRSACANRHYYIFSDNLDSFRFMMVDLSAQMIEGGIERLEPTTENIRAIVEEKEQGVELARKMIEKFNDIAPLLPNEMREKLDRIFKRTEHIALVMRYLIETIWNYFRWERTFSVRDRDGMRPDILRMLVKCEEVIDEAVKSGLEKAEGDHPWGLWRVVDFERARRMVEEIRGLINFRIGQRSDYAVTITPSTTGHPNTYHLHRKHLREIFGLPGE